MVPPDPARLHLTPETGVRVVVRRRTYPVVGSTAAHLRSAIGLLGPRRHGAAHAAHTDWVVHWSYLPQTTGGGYRVTAPRAGLEILCTMPQWRAPRSAGAELVVRWSAFLAALERHERGHVEIGVEAAAATCAALEPLAGFSSAEALLGAATEVAAVLLEAFRERDALYDAATEHGVAQGVVLP